MTLTLIWKYIVLFAGVTATPALTISYIPQIIMLHKTKSAEGIDKRFWYILNYALTMTTILAVDTFITTGSYAMLVAQGINLVLALVVMVQVVHYKKVGDTNE